MCPHLASPNLTQPPQYFTLKLMPTFKNREIERKKKQKTKKTGIHNVSVKTIRSGDLGPPSCLQQSPEADSGHLLQAGHVQACLAQTSLLSTVLLTLRLLVDVSLHTTQLYINAPSWNLSSPTTLSCWPLWVGLVFSVVYSVCLEQCLTYNSWLNQLITD